MWNLVMQYTHKLYIYLILFWSSLKGVIDFSSFKTKQITVTTFTVT